MVTAARASCDADVLGVISRHSSVDLAATPNAPIAREDDPELWAAIAASLDDQGGVEPPSPSQPCMQRHMSGVDPGIAHKLRQKRAQERWTSEVSGLVHFGPEDPATCSDSALLLPSFAAHPPAVRSLVLGELTNAAAAMEAEEAGVINAFPLCTRLLVLCTLGDGNCLDHAASMGVWGVQDRDGELRSALLASMQDARAGPQIQARFQRHLRRVGIPEESHGAEWEREVSAPRGDDYLSDIHAFALANVLRRPLLVYGDPQAAMAGMTGVYLPLIAAGAGQACWKEPVAVLFSRSHFSLLAAVEGEGPVSPPLLALAGAGQPLLPRFLTEEEESGAPPPSLPLLVRFMACVQLAGGALAVRLGQSPRPNVLLSLLRARLLNAGAEAVQSGGVQTGSDAGQGGQVEAGTEAVKSGEGDAEASTAQGGDALSVQGAEAPSARPEGLPPLHP
ncbi:hypothetical protein ACKKBG_A02890 [Auxenochlorella protothecoides x Auxenochlorella symbiontica]